MSPPPAVAVDHIAPKSTSPSEDPIWAAMLAAPVVEDDLSDEERAMLDEAEADIRAGRVVDHADVVAMIEEMRRAAGE